MTTSRRSFLRSVLTALCTAPLLARAAFADHPPRYLVGIDTALPGSDKADSYAMTVGGRAIKVPSNRIICHDYVSTGGTHTFVTYQGEWDGAFKLEPGCANPAYILADLIERTNDRAHWITHQRHHWNGSACHVNASLDWQMLYDWGNWCDEFVPTETEVGSGYWPTLWNARFTVNTVLNTREDIDKLREDLRMHCLAWQSTDPRYRTSWPGVPYPLASE